MNELMVMRDIFLYLPIHIAQHNSGYNDIFTILTDTYVTIHIAQHSYHRFWTLLKIFGLRVVLWLVTNFRSFLWTEQRTIRGGTTIL